MTVSVIDGGSVNRAITEIRVIDGGSVDRVLTQIRVIDLNGVDRIVFEPSGASSFSVSISPGAVHGVTHGTGTATTGTATVTPTGGTAPYTYAWSLLTYDAGTPPTATVPTGPATAFTQTGIGAGEFYTSDWRVTVTDNLGLMTTADITASFVDVT
jgi:hypothetical protein